MNSQLDQTLALQAPVGSSKTNLVAQAYQEYCDRRAGGERLDPEEYCDLFPAFRTALAKFVHAHVFLEENSFLLADPSLLSQNGALLLPGVAPSCFPKIGTTFLGFRLVEELGHGSFARVFLAEEPKLGQRRVAVKIALGGGAEANILGQVEHRNVVPVYSVQEDEETALTAVCMPFLGRATLGDVLDKMHLDGRLPTQASFILEAVQDAAKPTDPPAPPPGPARLLQKGAYADGIRFLGAQLADALAYIHSLGICHRDLKPSNVLLSSAGVPMLLDFNLSTEAANPRAQLGGTLPYMAPEQLRAISHQKGSDAAALDGRADVFSLGVILHELLTGRHPFGCVDSKMPGKELCQQLLQKQQLGPARIRDVNPEVDAGLADLIHRCLALDPAHRPQSAAELARLLWKGLSVVRQTCRFLGRHKVAACAAALLLLSTSIGAAFVIAQLPTPHERTVAAARALSQKGKFTEAVEEYSKALEIDRFHAPTYFARARTYQALGQIDRDAGKNDSPYFDSALRDFDRAQSLAPDGLTLACMGYCFNNLFGKNDDAINCYQQAIAAGFNTAEVANNLGFSLKTRKEYGPALKQFDEALSKNPRLQQAFHNRALVRWTGSDGILTKITELEKERKKTDAKSRAMVKSLSDETNALINLSMNDFEIAQQIGPPSARLSFDAAKLGGIAMRIDRQWADAALSHLKAALQLGLDPRQVNQPQQTGRGGVFALLKQDARFEDLLKGTYPPRPPTPSSLIVDPALDSAH